ncbi:MAG: RNA polymerase sigma factor, partial [Bacteroidota bacterium]
MEEIDHLKKQFLTFRPQLQSYLFRLLTSRQDAEDVLQDTYLRAFERIDQLREERYFKTWVFTIATNFAKSRLSRKRPWEVQTQDYGAQLHVQHPEHLARFMNVYAAIPDRAYEVRE